MNEATLTFLYIVIPELLKQGQRSTDYFQHKSICMYRGHDNRCCAVGFYIPDDEYSDCLELKTVHMVRDKISTLSGVDASDARTLQIIHDNDPVDDWYTNIDKTFPEVMELLRTDGVIK